VSVRPEVMNGVPREDGAVHLLKETPQGWPEWLPALIHETIHGFGGEPFLEAIVQHGGKSKVIPEDCFGGLTFSERIEPPNND
jgi:hypothetical protein